MGNQHNHPNGEEPANGGESPAGGEYLDSLRVTLAREIEAAGHGGCAFDLTAADDPDVARVAYEVAEHLEEGCGDLVPDSDLELARRVRDWADKYEALNPAEPRRRNLAVFTHREVAQSVLSHQNSTQLFVDVKTDDLLDLADAGDMIVTLTHDGVPLRSFHRMSPMEVTRDDIRPIDPQG